MICQESEESGKFSEQLGVVGVGKLDFTGIGTDLSGWKDSRGLKLSSAGLILRVTVICIMSQFKKTLLSFMCVGRASVTYGNSYPRRGLEILAVLPVMIKEKPCPCWVKLPQDESVSVFIFM